MEPLSDLSAAPVRRPRASPQAAPRRVASRFFLAAAVVAALSVVAGFFPTYFRPLGAGELEVSWLVHFHGLLFLGWTALFVAQPALVRARRVDLHRALGYGGAAMAALMVPVGVAVGLGASARGLATGDPEARPFLLITLTDMLLFAVLAGCAVALRRRPQAHKRLMLLATAALLPAAFGRLFWFGLGIEHPIAMHLGPAAFLAAGIAHDAWSRRRIHPAYLWGGGFLVAIHTLRLALAESEGWARAADWILARV